MSESRHSVEVNALLDALRARHEPENNSLVSLKNANVLVLGVIAACGALVWNTVTGTPKEFGVISQQTAEIRTTVLEMKTTLNDLTTRLDNNTRATADQQAKITGLESTVNSQGERLERLEAEVRDRSR